MVEKEVSAGKRQLQDREHVGGTVRMGQVHAEQQGDVAVRTKATAKDAMNDKGRQATRIDAAERAPPPSPVSAGPREPPDEEALHPRR
jgi:hypothetical protein